jgi:hypothetical protein
LLDQHVGTVLEIERHGPTGWTSDISLMLGIEPVHEWEAYSIARDEAVPRACLSFRPSTGGEGQRRSSNVERLLHGSLRQKRIASYNCSVEALPSATSPAPPLKSVVFDRGHRRARAERERTRQVMFLAALGNLTA